MADADYFAQPWYEESYSVQESERTSGDYSIQWCEVEIILDEALPKELTYEMQMGVRFYADSDATTFVSTGQPSFEWYREEMKFDPELNEEPVYEDKQTKKQAEEVFEITVEDVFAAFMDAYNAFLEALAAAEAEANSTDDSTAETQSSMAIGFRNKQEAAPLTASQSYSNGFSLYDGITASDWWTWTLSVDMPVGMVGDDYILYQWATMINQDDDEDTFTIACVRTVGDDTTMSARVYTQDSSSQTALYPDDSDNVVGLAWDSQAPIYLEEDQDHDWTATSDYTSLVGDSATDTNKIYGCYLAKELRKIGRSSSDFGQTYTVHVGARLYEDDSATTFTTIPMASSSFEYPEPPAYVVATTTEGAFALFASTMAALAVLFMAF